MTGQLAAYKLDTIKTYQVNPHELMCAGYNVYLSKFMLD